MAPRPGGADPRPSGLSLDAATRAAVCETVLGLDVWLDTMRRPGGYAGLVVHWWRDCLDYIGPGLDWRYEGIIIGYLNLWAGTGERRWLDKARRAGDDLVVGQLPSGNFRNSQFELNPGTGGTPHEAACDLALLRLAQAMRAANEERWAPYAHAAERNLAEYFIARLWDPKARSFRDNAETPSFVPNKAATLAEALLALAEHTGHSNWADQYALPALDAVLAHQVRGGALDGAIYQNSFGPRRVAKFFPFYVARCIPGLLAAFELTADERYADGAHRAARWVLSKQYPDGSYPQVVYPNGLVNRYPQWIAATGDMLRTLGLALGAEFDQRPTLRWLLAGRQPSGAIRAATGFGRATLGAPLNDPRDHIAVAGWADKAFRCLTLLLSWSTAD